MADIFISYAREDVATAQRLAEALEAQGWSVFWDRRIPAGRRFDNCIGEQLQAARCVIVLWSTASIRSEWVIKEAAEARERNVLAPALIDAVKPPFGFRHRQAADLINWQREKIHAGFERLIEDITSLIGLSAKQVEEERPRAEAKRNAEAAQRAREEVSCKADEDRQHAEVITILEEYKRELEEKIEKLERKQVWIGLIFNIAPVLILATIFIVTKAVVQYGLVVDLSIPGVLFYSYVLMGILYAFLVIYTMRRINITHKANKLYDLLVVAETLAYRDIFAKVRWKISTYCSTVAVLLAWPASQVCYFMMFPLRQPVDFANPLALRAFGSLQKLDYVIAAIVSGVLVIISLMAGPAWEENFYLRLFVIILLVHVTLRHAAYVLNLQQLQDGLRQSLGNPYIRLVTIAISDLISLTVAYGYLTAASHFGSISNLIDVMRSILSVQEVLDLLETKDAPAIAYFMKFSGLLFYVTIAKSVWQVKQFERNDKDFAAIGWGYLLQSRFMQAQQWFDKIRNPDRSMRRMRAIVYFGQGRLEDAIDTFQRSLDVSQAKHVADITIFWLISAARLIKIDKNTVRLLIEMGLKHKIKDSTLFCALMNIGAQDVYFPASEKAYPLSLALIKIMRLRETFDAAILKDLRAINTLLQGRQQQSPAPPPAEAIDAMIAAEGAPMRGDASATLSLVETEHAMVEMMLGMIEEIYTNLRRRQPRDPLDQICNAFLIIVIIPLTHELILREYWALAHKSDATKPDLAQAGRRLAAQRAAQQLAGREEARFCLKKILTITEGLSQDFDKTKAVLILRALVYEFSDEPALKEQVVESAFKTIREIDDVEVRDYAMAALQVVQRRV